jgi:predicted RNase H-like HicB family nuclease
MSQRKEIEMLMFDVLPYMANIEFIRELLESANSLEEIEQKAKELLEKEEDITKKTDLKILLEKIEERKSR